MPFTALEQGVLQLIRDAHPELEPSLGDLLASARLTKRLNTGHGFYTDFAVDPSLSGLDWPGGVISGLNAKARVGAVDLPMGFLLWLEDGRPKCLEGFQYGTEAGFVDLKAYDLASLELLGELR